MLRVNLVPHSGAKSARQKQPSSTQQRSRPCIPTLVATLGSFREIWIRLPRLQARLVRVKARSNFGPRRPSAALDSQKGASHILDKQYLASMEPPRPTRLLLAVMSTSQNSTPSQEAISARARKIWETAGSPDGEDLDHWLRAERELRNEAGLLEDADTIALESETVFSANESNEAIDAAARVAPRQTFQRPYASLRRDLDFLRI
jgi:hypothetical protein